MEVCKLTRHECKYAPFVDREKGCDKYCPYFDGEEKDSTPCTKVKICPYYLKYCDCSDEEYETCDLSTVYPRQTEEMFDSPFGSMKANSGKSDNPVDNALFDTRAIKPEKYAELREMDFDTWLDTILHEIIEQVNFDAEEVSFLGDAVWNGECPDGTPYPKVCAKEDAYIQCIRLSNQLDSLREHISALEQKLGDIDTLSEDVTNIKAWINAKELVNHTGSNFCGNCSHCTPVVTPKTSAKFHTCELSGEVIDPDESSCAMFEHPF